MPRDYSDFQFVASLPAEIPGINPELIGDLYDLVSKYGHPTTSDLNELIFGHVNLPFMLTLVHADAGPWVLRVRRSSQIGSRIRTLPILVRAGVVTWDPIVSVRQVRLAITAFDAILRQNGRIDPATGERLLLLTN